MKRSYPDRDVWVESYREENGGLQDSDTYEVISEEEYQRLRRHHGDAIPSMVVQTVKSVHGVPTRVKSRIVVLGNLEQHNWSKSDCYAPVMPLYQVRLLVSLAVANRRVLKQGDCKNAFCQSVLPDDEVVVVRPPVGCPNSQKIQTERCAESEWKCLHLAHQCAALCTQDCRNGGGGGTWTL